LLSKAEVQKFAEVHSLNFHQLGQKVELIYILSYRDLSESIEYYRTKLLRQLGAMPAPQV